MFLFLTFNSVGVGDFFTPLSVPKFSLFSGGFPLTASDKIGSEVTKCEGSKMAGKQFCPNLITLTVKNLQLLNCK